MKPKVNWLAVIVAAVAHFVLGAIWFTVLGPQWLAGIGKTMPQLQAEAVSPAVAYTVAFLCNIVIARVLAQIIVATAESSLMQGMKIAFFMWAGFVATTFLTAYVFEGRRTTIWAINAGYPLVGMLIMGAILGAWPAKAASKMTRSTAA